MITHNLKIAWRNLMKYKMQNLVSAVALAVGMVAMAVSVCVYDRMREPAFRHQPHSDRWYSVHMKDAEKKDKDIPGNIECFRSLRNLPSVEYFGRPERTNSVNENVSVTRLDSSSFTVLSDIMNVGSHYFKHYGFRSALTGKPFDELRPGQCVVSSYFAKKYFGNDSPVGATIREIGSGKEFVICDVMEPYSLAGEDWATRYSNFTVVNYKTDSIYEDPNLSMMYSRSTYELILRKGADISHFETQANGALASLGARVECTPWIAETSHAETTIRSAGRLVLLTGVLILAATLLGFFKMQIQLLWMRRREATLRAVHGARRGSLFATFLTEAAMTLGITFVLALCMGVWLVRTLQTYMLPILQQQGWMLTDIFPYIIAIGAGVLLWDALLIWANVRLMTRPAENIASRLQRGGGHMLRNAMLAIQTGICVLFIGCTWAIKQCTDSVFPTLNIPPDEQYLQRTLVVEIKDRFAMNEIIPHLKEIDDVEHIFTLCPDYIEPFYPKMNMPEGLSKADSVIRQGAFSSYRTFCTTDPEVLDFLDVKVNWFMPESERIGTVLLQENVYHTLLSFGAISAGTIKMYYSDDKAHVVGGTFTHFPYSTEYNKLGSVGRIILDEEKYYGGYCLLVPRKGAYEKVKSDIARTLALTPEKPFVHVNSEISNLRDKLIIKEIMVLQNIQLGAWILSLVSLVVCIMGIWSSISLDTRNRQKEVAVRKVHGAKRKDIALLFGRLYVCLLALSSAAVTPLLVRFNKALTNWVWSEYTTTLMVDTTGYKSFDIVDVSFQPYIPLLVGISVTAVLILLIVGYHLRKVMKVNPAEIIAKE